MPAIAIVGAGPGLGLSIARIFGHQGFSVALLARDQDKLDGLAAQLAQDGIEAAGFPADVMDRPTPVKAFNRILGSGARMEVTAYGRDPGRLGAEVACYKRAARDAGTVGAVLRPGNPDCESAAALRENVRNVRLAGAESVHFYHYGLYRERSLDWVREALTGSARVDPGGPSGRES